MPIVVENCRWKNSDDLEMWPFVAPWRFLPNDGVSGTYPGNRPNFRFGDDSPRTSSFASHNAVSGPQVGEALCPKPTYQVLRENMECESQDYALESYALSSAHSCTEQNGRGAPSNRTHQSAGCARIHSITGSRPVTKSAQVKSMRLSGTSPSVSWPESL